VKLRPLAILAFLMICTIAAIALSWLSSPQQEARVALAKLVGGTGLEVTFEDQRNRGVICGKYKHATGDWTPFIFVDHYSSKSPDQRILLTAVNQDKREIYGC